MSKTLNEIREEIDAIDNQVHDLLMQRSALVSSVAAAKKKEGLQIVQPAREARMMRRLLARHDGPLPRETVIRIWRELVGSVALMQTGFSVVVAAEGNEPCSYWDMAKNYFGSTVPAKQVGGVQSAITEARESDAVFAVMPWPEFNNEKTMPWWAHLFHEQSGERLSIICALPYGKNQSPESDVFDRAVVVSKIEFMPSGQDNSFIGLELKSDVSRAWLSETVQKTGLDLLHIYSGSVPHNPDSMLYLLEVSGFVDEETESFQALKDSISDFSYYCRPIGGYPVVPDTYDE